MKACLLAFGLLLAGAAGAQDRPVPPPRLPEDVRQPAYATLPDKPVPAITLGSLRVVLEETPLAAVVKVAPASVVDRDGDVVWICYTLPGARMWLVTTSTDSAVFGVIVSRLGSKPVKRCPSLPKQLRPLKFDRGLALGMSLADVKAKLGEPSRDGTEWWTWHHESQILATLRTGEKVEFTSFGTVYVRFKDGAVDAIRTFVNSTY